MKTLAVLGLAALAVVLPGCGGGGSTGTPSSVSTSAATGHDSTAPAKSPDLTFSGSKPRVTAQTRTERRAAGRAAAFVAPGIDNSVPTFGRESSPAERAAAGGNLRAYLSARAAEDWRRACSLLSDLTRSGYERLDRSRPRVDCAKVLPALAPLKAGVVANPLGSSELVAFRTQGESAFALFHGPPAHQQYIVPMHHDASGWRPTQAAAIAYPPGAAP